jgi:hypothetical protein
MSDTWEGLAPYRGKRITVRGLFDRFGWRQDRHGRNHTALIQALGLDDGTPLCEHVHVQHADQMQAYELVRGERVQFTAIVMSYPK